MKKFFAPARILMALCLLISVVLSGCGNGAQQTAEPTPPQQTSEPAPAQQADEPAPSQEAQGPDTSEQVSLVMYLLGDPARDYDEMLQILNEHMLADLNAALTVNWIGWGDYATRYPLLLASGEPIDLIYTADWAFYFQEAEKGAFLALDDLLPVYMPQTLAEHKELAWKQAEVNGRIYCVPMNYDELRTRGFYVRGDLMDKYGITEIKNTEDLDNYLIAVAQNETGIKGWEGVIGENYFGSINGENPYPYGSWVRIDENTTPIVYDLSADKPVLFNFVETEEGLQHFRRMYRLAQEGVFSRSVLANQTIGFDHFKNGATATTVANLLQFNQMYMDLTNSNPEWDVQYVNATSFGSVNSYMNNAMAVPISSKNPERALMLLEKLHHDRTYFNLTTYGIEGKHFEITGDNKLKLLEVDGFQPDNSCPWGWRSEKFYLDFDGSWAGLEDMRAWYKDNMNQPKLTGFAYSDENIKTELVNINDLYIQYGWPLQTGQLDPDASLSEYIEKLKTAGIDRVIEDIQAQVDAYLSAGN